MKRIREDREAGLTLVEVMVSLAIFSILMAAVATLLIFGLRSMFDASTANSVQAQQQNALASMSRLIRFIDHPTGDPNPDPAVISATSDSLAFFTWGAAGAVDRAPTKVLLCVAEDGLVEITWPPVVSATGTPEPGYSDLSAPSCADATGVRRVLVPAGDDGAPSVDFTYWRNRTASDDAGDGPIEVVPTGALTPEQLADVDAIKVSITDTRLAAPVEQSIALVNLP
jgi:prepilin-type N-terminal cleavage/methylation domain-containing protein